MATVSSAGGGSSMGNASQGTRGLSAGDWVRIQRIKAAKGYALTTGNASGDKSATSAIYPLNKDIAPPEAAQQPYGTALMIPYQAAGTHKTLRPASNWTDYIASQTGDFITVSQNSGVNGTGQPGIVQTQTKICAVTPGVLAPKALNTGVNAFNRLKILS